MGKYEIDDKCDVKQDTWIRLCIANELAEANRLKRLELDLLISLHRDELKKSDELFHYREELEESKHEE